MTVALYVGYVGKTRDGKRVEIVSLVEDGMDRPFIGNNAKEYKGNGKAFNAFLAPSDIIGPWVEPVKDALTKYTEGKWHTHDGKHVQDMPEGLNPKSTVRIRDTIVEGLK